MNVTLNYEGTVLLVLHSFCKMCVLVFLKLTQHHKFMLFLFAVYLKKEVFAYKLHLFTKRSILECIYTVIKFLSTAYML